MKNKLKFHMLIDTGDTAWMLVAGMLVLLMIPALGLFESGLLRKKNVVSILSQIIFGLALLICCLAITLRHLAFEVISP